MQNKTNQQPHTSNFFSNFLFNQKVSLEALIMCLFRGGLWEPNVKQRFFFFFFFFFFFGFFCCCFVLFRSFRGVCWRWHVSWCHVSALVVVLCRRKKSGFFFVCWFVWMQIRPSFFVRIRRNRVPEFFVSFFLFFVFFFFFFKVFFFFFFFFFFCFVLFLIEPLFFVVCAQLQVQRLQGIADFEELQVEGIRALLLHPLSSGNCKALFFQFLSFPLNEMFVFVFVFQATAVADDVTTRHASNAPKKAAEGLSTVYKVRKCCEKKELF